MARLENLLGVLGVAVADRILAGAGSSDGAALVTLLAHQPRSTGWLGEVLGLTSSGVTRLVDRLTAAGWVERSPGTDARRRDLTLTPAGAQRAREVLAAREGGLGELLDPLDAGRRAELEVLLENGGRHTRPRPSHRAARVPDV